jgi:singapore isolate B (sub-type 7) whole genome shotgun sequence assembly, scaffold_8
VATSQNPYVSVHGSFSLSTNFHAIDVFVERHKGHIFKSPYLEGFNVGAHAESHMQNTVYVMGIDLHTLPTMRWMIHHAFSTYVPESFNTTQKCLKEESSPSPSVAAVISVLRLARFDTDVFMKFKQVLIERGGYAGSSPATRKDILYDLSGVRNQYYPIKSTYDVCFELARIHMGIKVG